MALSTVILVEGFCLFSFSRQIPSKYRNIDRILSGLNAVMAQRRTEVTHILKMDP